MLFPAGKDAEAADVLERLKRGETVGAHDAVRRRKDGHNIDVSVRISPIFDPLGNLVGASKVARDVTELKQMKTELEIRRAQAVSSVRLSELGMMAGSRRCAFGSGGSGQRPHQNAPRIVSAKS
jgi:hypothetical protein